MIPACKIKPYLVCKTERMDRAYLEIIFLCGLILQIILISPYLQDYFPKKWHDYFNKRERLYLLFMCVGFQLLPLIYILSIFFPHSVFSDLNFLSRSQTWLPLYVFPAGTPQSVNIIAVDPNNPRPHIFHPG